MARARRLIAAMAVTALAVGVAPAAGAGDDQEVRTSWGLESPAMAFAGVKAKAIEEGLDYAWTRGAVPVLAAGSPRRLGIGLGTRSDRDLRAVVVAATGPDGRMATSSPPTGDARLAVLAPGGNGGNDPASDVLSTFWATGRHDIYETRGGTSAAAAYVSGALALLLAEGYNAVGAVERLLLSADGTVHCGQGSPSCYGLMDVARATAGPVQQSSR